ncbi:DUF4350 domain-containing protein [Halalkalicoccus jeotgali]|uniref:Nuclease-like protein n=1 Tax=Halalkalicoccus jeotgali (strain DSM 18796 / CECT 7217 / JCM 14584 / KCTC 4019 / B3) TaxID=795797 RepID=D8J7T4_HALJB|nr:DUF4350 domain-containing protein [Halalkalicoccus jeotgali]ADJ16104.1 nuclease-like protein [Halalkalicoccus jeotgali B3]ELY38199.1 nuclease-like protein [Halalkalicoccus jeotgali B3]
MNRRTFLATAGVALSGPGIASAAPPTRPPIRLYSPASQLAADGSPLTDDSVVAAWAEPTAYNRTAGRSEPVRYDGSIPLVSIDGRVAGIGSMLVADPARQGGHATYADSNGRALLALWDALVDGTRVRWDATHDQYWSLDAFGRFRDLAGREGYELGSADAVDRSTLADADGLVVTTPPRAFDPEELDALAAFVDRGGALFLHDQATFRGLDETDNLNAIAERLDLAFRFNADEVNDDEANAGAPFEVLTTAYDPDQFV